jgi:phospholipid transport system substrate-binding protein
MSNARSATSSHSISGFNWRAWLVAAAMLMATPALWAADPESTVRETTQAVMDAVKADRSAIENDPALVDVLIADLVAPRVDFEIMSRVVLGQHWRTASPDQRVRFVEAFRGFLIRFYSSAIKEFVVAEGIPEQVDVKVVPLRAQPTGKSTRVKSQIIQKGRAPVEVSYGLYRRGDDDWRFVDLQVEGISLVINYRQSFAREIRTSGIESLIANLAANKEPA